MNAISRLHLRRCGRVLYSVLRGLMLLALACWATDVTAMDAAMTPSAETASLPASIRAYNAASHQPDAAATQDHNAYSRWLCHQSAYRCIDIQPGMTWALLAPDPHRREILMRLNRTNVALKYRHWIVEPKEWQDFDYMKNSPLPQQITPSTTPELRVNLAVFAFGVYNKEGQLLYWGPASGGRAYCDDTHEDCHTVLGHYRIYRVQGEQCRSSKYPIATHGGAPMPYCMHFFRGYALHGSTLAGFVNHSRGCVRLFYSDAKWLQQRFAKIGTRVVIVSSFDHLHET